MTDHRRQTDVPRPGTKDFASSEALPAIRLMHADRWRYIGRNDPLNDTSGWRATRRTETGAEHHIIAPTLGQLADELDNERDAATRPPAN